MALNRHAAQQVQKGFAGEMAPEMMNPAVAFMMQFKSYPLLAAQKQQARNLQFGDKEAAMGLVLNAASSYAARYLRYSSMAAALPEKDRERYMENKLASIHEDSAKYMGYTGMLGEIYNLGNTFGLYGGDEATSGRGDFSGLVPAMTWGENYADAIGGAHNLLMSEKYDEKDVARLQGGAPLGTIAQVNIIAGIIRDKMAEE